MKIGMQRDSSIELDIASCVHLLNSICKFACFSALPTYNVNKNKTGLDFDEESNRLTPLQKSSELDLIVFVTKRAYSDNYYFYEMENILVLSLAHWEHYTNLPPENGVLFFIASFLPFAA